MVEACKNQTERYDENVDRCGSKWLSFADGSKWEYAATMQGVTTWMKWVGLGIILGGVGQKLEDFV